MAEPESDRDEPTEAESEAAPEREPEPEQEPEPEPEPAPEPAMEEAKVDALISDSASSASIDALAKLAEASEPEPATTTELRVGGQGRTVEDIVTEMLRPILREWLDENLPIIVDRIVQKEIRKLVRQADPE